MSGVAIGIALFALLIAFVVIGPAVLILRDARTSQGARVAWAVVCAVSCPLSLAVVGITFHAIPEIASFVRADSTLDRIANVVIGLAFGLPYLTLLAFRRYGMASDRTVETDARKSGARG